MPTDYIVFRKNGLGWEEMPGVHSGASRRAAIQEALASKKDIEPADGEYAAVPARSWKPIKVAMTKSLKFG